MRDKLHAYLMERPAGASPRELLDLIFTQPGADPELGPRFLRALLGGDPRFAFREDGGHWIATAHDALARPLAETSFVVVDLETTGGSAQRGDAIIEIGAVRVARGRLAERFARLVNPGRRLPPFITRLTGITDAMLADQADVRVAVAELLTFAGDGVLVAHNARFDLPFLDAALRLALGRAFHQPHLCTLRLARRLLPNLRRRSLDSLAGHLGIPVVDRHRALGDAIMTAEVLLHFLELLARRGVTRLDRALDFQYGAADGRRFVCPLPRRRVDELPEAPGIYRFSGGDGSLLYIGKAVNLRQRVSSYLSNSAGHSRKTLDLIRHIRHVEARVTGSELEASLLEAEEIRRCQPPYNRLRKHLPRIAFLRLSAAGEFPRLSVTGRMSGRAARFFGPFRSRVAARRALDLLARLFRLRTCTGRLRPAPEVTPCLQGQIDACSAPCAARAERDRYAEQVAGLLRFFDEQSPEARLELERRRDAHSAALRFEAAARLQRDIELLEQMGRRQRRLSWIVERHHFVVLQPCAGGSGAMLYGVLHGRLRERRRVGSAAELASVAAHLSAGLRAPPERLQPADVDGTTILAAWLRERGERDGYVFPLDGADSVEARLPEWAAALDSLLAARTGADAVQ